MCLRTRLVLSLVLASLSTTAAFASTTQDAATSSLPEPKIFAPGEISGPANDGAPTFSPDGNTLFFTRSAAHWTVIVESHIVDGHWSRPVVAPFSGEWPDSSPAMSPDGSYIVFQSTRPKVPLTDANRPKPGEPIPGIVSNLWRVDREGLGYGSLASPPTGRFILRRSTRKETSVCTLLAVRMTLTSRLNRWRSVMGQRWMSIRRLHRMDRFWSL
jgi:hypothetical protein